MNGRSIKINKVPATIAACLVTFLLVYLFSSQDESNRPAFYRMLRHQNKVNLRKLLIGSVQAAQRGGLEILEVARTRNLKERSKGKTDEGVNDPFTDADGRSHCVMKHGLQHIFPRIKIYSEEDKEHCNESSTYDLDPTVLHETADLPDILVNVGDVTIWIDPLDATKEFTEELYQYVTTMVCIAVRGKPIIGVIHNPFNGETAWAWDGYSMSEYLSSLRSKNHHTTSPTIIVSRSHPGEIADITEKIFGKNAPIIYAAGSGYKVLQVIANNATVYLHSSKIKKWDICAGNAILNALGGEMTTLNDKIIDYGPDKSPVHSDGLIATLTNHQEYIEKIMSYKKTKISR